MNDFRVSFPTKWMAVFAGVALAPGCSLIPNFPSGSPGKHAFITYWGSPEKSDRLRLAVKDNIDMKGVVTTAGSEYLAKNSRPAKSDAPCLAIARQRGVE